MEKNKLYFEDLHVGQRFASGTHRITAEEIKEFAARFDPQPFHLDESAAAQSIFKGLVASGWHTAALTMRLLVDSELSLSHGIVGLGGDLNWLNPTRPGDTLRVEIEVLELTPHPSKTSQGRAKFRVATLNQRDEILQVFEANIIAFKKNRVSS